MHAGSLVGDSMAVDTNRVMAGVCEGFGCFGGFDGADSSREVGDLLAKSPVSAVVNCPTCRLPTTEINLLPWSECCRELWGWELDLPIIVR
jgi:hypothetical protein